LATPTVKQRPATVALSLEWMGLNAQKSTVHMLRYGLSFIALIT
jgi:hypothetical protein